jgi:hypothetical protein
LRLYPARMAACVALRSMRYSATKRYCFGVKGFLLMIGSYEPLSLLPAIPTGRNFVLGPT